MTKMTPLAYVLTFKWMSKDFMIRAFIILFWLIVALRIRAGKIDNELVGIVVAQLTALIGLKSAEKIMIVRAKDEKTSDKK